MARYGQDEAMGWGKIATFICFALAGVLLLAALTSPDRSTAASAVQSKFPAADPLR